jgi:apolipoprotein N-acyltransferase
MDASRTTPLVKLARLSHVVVLAWGWRRSAIALAAGVVSALAFAPINAWPVLFCTFPIAVFLLDGSASGRLGGVAGAATAGWWFGFGFFLAGLYWVGFAFLVDAATFGWLMPFAVISLPAGLALFTAFGFAVARALWTRGAVRIVTLAVSLTAAEWLRGHVLTGFPWNTYGYSLTGSLALAQGSALVGIWGLTLFGVGLFASPALLCDDPIETPRPWLLPVVGLAGLAVLAVYGTLRLQSTPTAFVPGVRLRIMQPNLPQDDKFNYSAREGVMARYLALSDRATGPDTMGVGDATHLIWPESPFPFLLSRNPYLPAEIDPQARADFRKLLGSRTVLITGAARAAPRGAGGTLRAYNSVYLINHDGAVLDEYDKVHLVPFGEYLPFQERLASIGLMGLTKMPGGFVPGTGRKLINVPGAPHALPLICYEIVFPDQVGLDGERPGWLLNVTNDGWFGDSSGPYQHMQQARLRAVEQGLPLVRAANTGISAVIDPVGRVIKELPLGVEGVLDAPLPQPLAPTFYARHGDTPVEVAFGIAVVVVLRRRWRS